MKQGKTPPFEKAVTRDGFRDGRFCLEVNVLGGAVWKSNPTAVLCRRSFLYVDVAQSVEQRSVGNRGTRRRGGNPWTKYKSKSVSKA